MLTINGCISYAFGFTVQTKSPISSCIVVEPALQRCQQIHKGNKETSYHQSMPSSTSLTLVPDIAASSESTFLIAETEEWRQYVLLFVSLGVLLDVLLGNPLANIALAPMRRAAMEKEEGSEGNAQEEDSSSSGRMSPKKFVANPRERVDSEAVGKAALEKARYSMELRKFLEENKTDEQKYEDMRREIDKEAAKFDSRKGE